jgi:hypothetical protein
VRAPHRRRHAAFVGRSQTVVLPVHRFAPPVYDGMAGWLMDNVELRGEGADVTTGTVFDAPSSASPATGGWRSRRGPVAIGAIAVGLAAIVLSQRRHSPAVSITS